jgi:hypothetical protein
MANHPERFGDAIHPQLRFMPMSEGHSEGNHPFRQSVDAAMFDS